MTESTCQIENTIPVLAVAEMAASLRFYQSLGFQIDWEAGKTIAQVSRDRHPIMLQRRDASPGWVWIGCTSVTSLWQEIHDRSDISIAQRPTNQPWALEMKIHDPDRNILWFGSDSQSGVPFGTEPV